MLFRSRRSGCGWRRGNQPSQSSSSNSRFSPRTIARKTSAPQLVVSQFPVSWNSGAMASGGPILSIACAPACIKRPRSCWRGQVGHAARAAGWYPAPAHIPNSGPWNWFHDRRSPAVIPGKGGTVWRCLVLLLRGGAPHTPQPPRRATPASRLKKT